MNCKVLNRSILIAALALVAARLASANGEPDLAALRAATARFHQPAAAQAAGYGFVPGLDHCFNNPGVGAMGYHLINVSLIDTTVDALNPEAMVYVPGPEGHLQLGAVEYVVPAAAWDAESHGALPALHGQSFHLNASLGVYVLHAWVWRHNPAGLFEDWNPTVTCPA